jgi:hypothetical protein
VATRGTGFGAPAAGTFAGAARLGRFPLRFLLNGRKPPG